MTGKKKINKNITVGFAPNLRALSFFDVIGALPSPFAHPPDRRANLTCFGFGVLYLNFFFVPLLPSVRSSHFQLFINRIRKLGIEGHRDIMCSPPQSSSHRYQDTIIVAKGGNVREIQKAYKHKSKVNKRRKKKKEDIKRERSVYRGGYGHL